MYSASHTVLSVAENIVVSHQADNRYMTTLIPSMIRQTVVLPVPAMALKPIMTVEKRKSAVKMMSMGIRPISICNSLALNNPKICLYPNQYKGCTNKAITRHIVITRFRTKYTFSG